MQAAAQLRGLPHAAHVGAGLDPALRKDWTQRIGCCQDDIHTTHGLFGIVDTPNTDTEHMHSLVAEFLPPLGIAAGDGNFFYVANGEQSLENAEGVAPDAEQAQALSIFPRHMLGGDGYHRRGSQGPEWKTHEREQLAGLRIKKQGVHLVAAAETAIRAQSYSDSSRFQSSARDYAQAAVAADRNMVRRVGNDFPLCLLPVGLFDQLDRFFEIKQRSQFITSQ